MVTETTNEDFTDLLPDRHPQRELFVCDVADAALKDIMQHMEHPFYSLSKHPDTRIRRYEHNGEWVEITPSVKGLATIYDKDILIYCTSQIIAKLKRGEKVSKRVRVYGHDVLVFTNRGTSGPEYDALEEAIDRLAGTRIGTNIKTNNTEEHDNFGLIERGTVRRKPRKNGKKGRILWFEVTLSDWVFNAIEAKEVLTLHPTYFGLGPVEKRIYELARKHCGHQTRWSISVEKLWKKSGSQSPLKRFRQMVKALAEVNHLPDYSVALDENDNVVFRNRNTMKPKQPELESVSLRSPTYDAARMVAPGWDIDEIEQEWRSWMTEPPRDADAAFLGFCQKWYERRGSPA